MFKGIFTSKCIPQVIKNLIGKREYRETELQVHCLQVNGECILEYFSAEIGLNK
jgi:hypothetical protein